jgi:hypothetical protein
MSAIRFVRAVLVASALAFGLPGLGFLLAPEAFAARVDVALRGPDAWSDARAVLGGLELGIAALLAACASRTRWLRVGVAVQLATIGGLLLGRFASLAFDGAPGALGWALLAIELALGGAGVVAARRARTIL